MADGGRRDGRQTRVRMDRQREREAWRMEGGKDGEDRQMGGVWVGRRWAHKAEQRGRLGGWGAWDLRSRVF